MTKTSYMPHLVLSNLHYFAVATTFPSARSGNGTHSLSIVSLTIYPLSYAPSLCITMHVKTRFVGLKKISEKVGNEKSTASLPKFISTGIN